MNITWYGLTASYSLPEKRFMRRLALRSRREAWRVHVLKALCNATEVPERKERS